MIRDASRWTRWLALLLVALVGLAGPYAAATCQCGHEEAAHHDAEHCADGCADACQGLCLCHLAMTCWQPPAPPAIAVVRLAVLDTSGGLPGDANARLIYSPPRG